MHINMDSNSSARYYQKNKERLQKKPRERFQNLFKEEKEKKVDLVTNYIEIFPNLKNKGWLSTEMTILKYEKIVIQYLFKPLRR